MLIELAFLVLICIYLHQFNNVFVQMLSHTEWSVSFTLGPFLRTPRHPREGLGCGDLPSALLLESVGLSLFTSIVFYFLLLF